MNEASAEFAGLYLVALARVPVNDLDVHTGVTNPIAQFRREIPLDLLAAELPDARQQWLDLQLGAVVGKQHAPCTHRVARIAFCHVHLVSLAIAPRRGHGELLTHRPEAEQAYAELALDAFGAVCLETTFDRIADVGAHVAKIRNALVISRYALTVIADRQVMVTPFPTTGDIDLPGTCVDAVLDELGHCFERIALRQRDDGDGVPVVTDTKPPGVARLAGFSPGFRHRGHAICKAHPGREGGIQIRPLNGFSLESTHQDPCRSDNSTHEWNRESITTIPSLSPVHSLARNARCALLARTCTGSG